MESACTNTALITKEKKFHLIIAWIALIVALVMLAYIGYHVFYKGFAYATKLVNNPEDNYTDENFLALIIALAGACSIILYPLGKAGFFTFLYAFTFLAGILLSIFAIPTVINAFRIITKKTKPNSTFRSFAINFVIMAFIFLQLLIRR